MQEARKKPIDSPTFEDFASRFPAAFKARRNVLRKERRVHQRQQWAVRAQDQAVELLLYGVIGDSFWGGISAESVVQFLSETTAEEIIVRIHSEGGDALDAIAIYNALERHDARVRVEIEGAAMSAASIVALAGDDTAIVDNGLILIHDPWTFAVGDAAEMREVADVLDKVGDLLARTYASATGESVEYMRELMRNETTFDAQEALEVGLVDKILTRQGAETDQEALLNAYHRLCATGRIAAFLRESNMSTPIHLEHDDPPTDATEESSAADTAVTSGGESAIAPVEAPEDTPTEAPPPAANMDQQIMATLQRFEQQRQEERRSFLAEVNDLFEIAGLPKEGGSYMQAISETDIRSVRKLVKDLRAQVVESSPLGPGPQVVGEGRDRLRSAITTAVAMRGLSRCCDRSETIEQLFPQASRSKDATDFQYANSLDVARECLRVDGFSDSQVRRLSNEQTALAALGFYRQAGIRAEGGIAADNTTASLPNITLDAANKTLQAGYTEAPSTWEGPMRQGESAPDFKNINRIRLGAVPNLTIWIDNLGADRVKLADAKEAYAVESYSSLVSVSWKAVVNDDLGGVVGRMFPQLGAAARRTVNAIAWAEVTSNPTMSDDSVALFSAVSGNRKRSNLTTGAGAPSVSTVQTLTNLMMQMRGENTPEDNESDDILGLIPRYIIGPSALATTIKQLVLSAYDPAANQFQTYNTATELIPVIEPLLDTTSTTAWYLWASPQQIDTVEVTFLQGQETPIIRDFVDNETWSQNFQVIQTVAAKALNHRGMQRHDGV